MVWLVINNALRRTREIEKMTYKQQVSAIIENIENVLKPEFIVTAYAAAMLEEKEVEDGHFEVRGLHTRSGIPHTFTI